MTNLLARILLAIMLLPLGTVLYAVIVVALIKGPGNDALAFTAATLVTAVFVVVYWLALWRQSVRWTSERIGRTLFASLGSVIVGAIGGAVLMALAGINEVTFGIFIGGVIAMVTWLPVTVLLWRETPEERVERLRHAATDVLCCPRCGYNMTGLHEARCPECGAQYTLNQLYSAQHHAEIGDAAPAGDGAVEAVQNTSQNNLGS